MSAILEIIVFLAMCLTNIFSILENTVLSGYSMLDWLIAMMLIDITFWGIFSLISPDNNERE